MMMQANSMGNMEDELKRSTSIREEVKVPFEQ